MKRSFAQILGLGAVLYALWLLLSGHYTPFLLVVGLLATAFAVFIALRMELVDEEGVPVVHLTLRIFTYIPWLVGEVVKSNLTVTRIILRPELPISPAIIRVRALQQTELGRTIFANSITLTPGTITVGVRGEVLYVHALDEAGATGMDEAEMNVRVVGVERKLVLG